MSEGTKSPAFRRLEALLDDNSFVELCSSVTSRTTDFNLTDQKTPSDGVITGSGLICGRPVFVFSQDASVLNGSIGEMHARKILQVYDLAVKTGTPVVGLFDCSGVRLQESFDATEAIGAICRKASDASGVIPQVCGVFGQAGGAMNVLVGMFDFAYMEKDASLFFHSPDSISGNRREKMDPSSADYQYEHSGLVDGIGSEDEILASIRDLCAVLPQSNRTDGFEQDSADDLNRASSGLDSLRDDLPAFLREISDSGLFIETKAGYATDMVTGFVSLDGITVGAIGNASSALTSAGARKGADFVRFCDAFDVPVLSLTNLEGYASSIEEEATLGRAAASLASAFASATVPKINLITKNAFGSAYLLMNSKSLGADLVLAYPDADMKIMDANLAASVICEDASLRRQMAAEFDEKANGLSNAARRGVVDRIVSFADTRKYLIAGFEMLASKIETEEYKKHTTK